MGFSIHYRSTRPVGDAEADAIRQAAGEANAGRTWLSCEPVHFFAESEDGCLVGGSKPNFLPHPDDAAALWARNARHATGTGRSSAQTRKPPSNARSL